MTTLDQLIGNSPEIVVIRDQVRRLLQKQSVARRQPPILILGESGTGKGALAEAIHATGPRAAGPFLEVNCAALPEALLESELFGFERGAFTDARHAKPGLFQAADGGTIFLDELSLLPRNLQAKLLKVVEQRTLRRLGSVRDEPVDVWILAASSEDLLASTRAGSFREDLYHRLAVVSLRLPPLRQRGSDILLLAEHLLARACADYAIPPKTFAAAARAALLAQPWPGNVRELANVTERIALFCDAAEVTLETLGLGQTSVPGPAIGHSASSPSQLKDVLVPTERAHVLEVLERARWNVTRAAVELGVSRDTLRYRMAKHGLRTRCQRDQRAPAVIVDR